MYCCIGTFVVLVDLFFYWFGFGCFALVVVWV